MKKIALITPGVLPLPSVRGGAVETLINLFIDENNLKEKYDLTVFSIDDSKIDHSKLKEEFTHYVHIKNNSILSFFDRVVYWFARTFFKKKNVTTFKNIFNRFRFFISIRKYLRKNDFDLIILENHCAEYLALKPRDILKKYNKKVVFHSHNEPAHYKYFVKIMKITKTIFCVSKAVSNEWKKRLSKYDFLSNIDYAVVKNGIDISSFTSETNPVLVRSFKCKLKLPPHKTIILFAGRMTKQKGIFELLEAFRNLDNTYHLLLVGDFFFDSKTISKETKLIEQKLDLIKGRFTFTGYVPYCDMHLVYSVSDLVVLPSISFDAAPLTLIESICTGKPVISTNVGGIPEYAKDNGVVLLDVDEQLSKKLSETIASIANNPQKISSLSKQSISNRIAFDRERYFERYCEIVDNNIGDC